MSSPDETPWACGVCTFSNHGLVPACEMCGTARLAAPPAAVLPEQHLPRVEPPAVVEHEAVAPPPAAAAAAAAASVEEHKQQPSPSSSSSAAAAAVADALAQDFPALQLPPLRPRDAFVAMVERAVGYSNEPLLAGVERLCRDRLGLGSYTLPAGWQCSLDEATVAEAARAAVRSAAMVRRVADAALRELRETNAQQCVRCLRPGSDAFLLASDVCGHLACMPCLRAASLGAIESPGAPRVCLAPAAACGAELSASLVRQVLSADEFERFLAACMADYQRTSGAVVRCPAAGCGAAMEADVLDEADVRVPDPIRKRDERGNLFSREAYVHFSRFRFRCRECGADFCASCEALPYHGGFTCEAFAEYGVSRHCRFCGGQLPAGGGAGAVAGVPALADVCGAEECAGRAAKSCRTVLPCGHPCGGGADERPGGHLECLHEACVAARRHAGPGAVAAAAPGVPAPADEQTADDLCNVCWVEGLGQAPAVRLACGHVFHHHCVASRVSGGWPGQRITFGHLDCPLCGADLDCGNAELLALLRPVRELRELLNKKALVRLRIEGMEKDERVVDPSSRFYQKPLEYAMASFAYYRCFKCAKPYFGGRRDCEQNASDDRKPADEFVCYDCAGTYNVLCGKPEHREFYVWKCRFGCGAPNQKGCGGVAVWQCWPTRLTRFCEAHHAGKIGGQPYEIAKWPRSKFPQCPGPALCPLGGNHAPNGAEPECEQPLYCSVCRNERQQLAEAEEKENDEVEGGGGAAAGAGKKKKKARQQQQQPRLNFLSALFNGPKRKQ